MHEAPAETAHRDRTYMCVLPVHKAKLIYCHTVLTKAALDAQPSVAARPQQCVTANRKGGRKLRKD